MRKKLFTWLFRKLGRHTLNRPPDFVIGSPESPYLCRWWLIPRNRFFNIYLHEFRKSDDDRAMHDHPWSSCSVLLGGEYTEHTIQAGGIHKREVLKQGAIRFRSGKFAHRIELPKTTFSGYELPCWTLFITGPAYRKWGFHCPDQGWIPWERFTAADNKGSVGAGCDG